MSLDHNSSPKSDLNTKTHISNSVYFSSEEFNMLRKELYDHWRDQPGTEDFGGRTLWWYSGLMVTNPAAFVEVMSLELGLRITFDSGKEAEICLQLLNACRAKRNLPPLSGSSHVIS